MFETYELLFLISAILIVCFLFWATIVSKKENEIRATKRFLLLSVIAFLFTINAFIFGNEFFFQIVLIIIAVVGLFAILLFLPFGNNKSYAFPIPKKRIDERDTMFSRNELKKGTSAFNDYYARNPEFKVKDDKFRNLPGILGKKAKFFNAFHFASSAASFETIEVLYDEVDGKVNPDIIAVEKKEISNYIKSWAKKLGAVNCGITNLQEYHIYNFGGRQERRDKKLEKKHEFAIAFTVEMDKQMVDNAPYSGIVMESGQQYLESGRVAIQMAKFIRNLGYEARAHIDGNYEVVCPLVARDAGLGEIGRMGLLMTPRQGPRVRIGVVTTNIPLVVDEVKPDFSIIDFCTICKKCADSCPSQAISFNPQEEIDGIKRWQINQEACFTLWSKFGTDCGRCMSVCPYSHEDNTLHNLVRFGIKNNYLFRRMALKMDDVFYGRKPKSKDVPKSLKI